MKVKILGTGCARCDNLLRNAEEAVGRIPEINGSVKVEKVIDPEEFFRLKVFVTPALVINDKVISSGKVLTVDEIQSELLKRLHGEDK
ncbi:MAG: thioredoxin family protein [Desulfomonile tiedjei]|uniref:Thioredoxin family protein n=1 Tax=Desulfomonile tiedjei TaxID=2358 RepID=A0A9D6V6E2_9BACT|nr:thioredoxin family protein [Desulfomonile tiedjei]